MIGVIAMSDAAKTRPQSVACCPLKSWIAMGNVRFASVFIIVRAWKNSSQKPVKANIAKVPRAGFERGKII